MNFDFDLHFGLILQQATNAFVEDGWLDWECYKRVDFDENCLSAQEHADLLENAYEIVEQKYGMRFAGRAPRSHVRLGPLSE